MFIVTATDFQGDNAYEIQRLRSLADDLERMLNRQAPTEAELARAPTLDGYGIVARPRPCLIGHAESHPVLGERTIRTSELWAFAPDLGWARTHSRFYKLGARLGEKVN